MKRRAVHGGRISSTRSVFLFVSFDERVKYWLQTHGEGCAASRLFACSAVGAPARLRSGAALRTLEAT